MLLKPIATEKATKLIDTENTLLFETDRRSTKEEIKREISELLNVKIKKLRTHIKGNKKYAYVKLNRENPAIDAATKLGIM